MRRHGCITWAGPELDDIEHAARVVADAPEVWAPADHPHLGAIARLWPNATLRTVGTTPPTLHRRHHIHHDGDAADLELLTLDRPRRTVVLPWPEPASDPAPSPDAPS